MGRPRKPPAITAITLPDGTVVFRVRWVVRGVDRRKVVASAEEARLLASQWMNDRKEDLRVLATRLTPPELGEAEAASLLLKPLGLGLLDSAKWVLANYKAPSRVEWSKATTEYETERRKVGISESQITNVSKAARRFAAFVGRPHIGSPTRLEIEGVLATLPTTAGPTSYNGLLGDLGTFLGWLVTKGYCSENPAAGMERRRVKRTLPAVLAPDAVEALLQDLETRDPGWVPYAACCVFGALRPGIREGEANRFDADLRAGRKVIHPGGLEVNGKAHGVRIVPWELCGPLRLWLAAYPAAKGLWPSATPTIAEREWGRIREKHRFPAADVLRHTAISAMCYRPKATLAEVAIGAGTSEAKIRSNYLGRWSAEMTSALWALVPSVRPVKCA